jgi:hypothetical protein
MATMATCFSSDSKEWPPWPLAAINIFLPQTDIFMTKKNAYRILMGKPQGKRPLGIPRRKLVDNVKMGLGEI